MKTYEIMYILKPDLDEAQIKEVRAAVEGYLTSNGAKIESEDV
jgi:ribosomal protein S6